MAAAAVVIALVLGVQVSHLHHQVSALQANPLASAAQQSALQQPSTKQVELTAPATSPATTKATVVLTAAGDRFRRGDRLRALSSGKTYQLWGVIGGRTISLGLLGPHPSVVPSAWQGLVRCRPLPSPPSMPEGWSRAPISRSSPAR